MMCPVLGTPAQENRDRLLQQNSGRSGCRDQHVVKPLCLGGTGVLVAGNFSVLGCFRKVFRNSCLLIFYILLFVMILILNSYFNDHFNYVLFVS